VWNQAFGYPLMPSARTDQNGTESMILFQCVEVTGGAGLDFSAYSFTHSAVGLAANGVSLSVFPTLDCSGPPIETVPTDQGSFPDWYLRERFGYITPANTLSARIELSSEANGTVNNISWDSVKLITPSTPTETRTWGSIKAIYK
jgi:hypothetical protein